MKTYSTISPSLEGILSDDALYFEGARRPPAFFVMRDGLSEEKVKEKSEENILIMEKYFNDIHSLFLRKLSNFSNNDFTENENKDEESIKLQALLQELIKVKGLIENSSKVAIMRE